MSASRSPEAPFRRADGTRVTTSSLLEEAHGLPVLLAFFKTSCPTCKLAWPYLQRLHAAYGGTAVTVVGVSQNGIDESRKFFEDWGGATFDLVLDPEPTFAASNAFSVESVPHLVLVAPDGSVEDVFAGWSRKRMEALGARLAARANVPPVPVVPPGDLVGDFKAG